MKKIFVQLLFILFCSFMYAETSIIKIQHVKDNVEFNFYDLILEFNENKEEMISTCIGADEEIYEFFCSYTIGYSRKEGKINYIKLFSEKMLLEIDNKKINFFGNSLQEIENQIGGNYRYLSNNTIEYIFKTEIPIIDIYVSFHFNNDKCIYVEIYDTSLFI